jgi:DNA-directed RNA polymerase specialized sigma24 family protein
VPGTDSDDSAADTRVLLETMVNLPERERLALHAFYLQGESAEVVQSLLGLSASGAYRVLERARQRLATLLADKLENVP